MPLPGKFPGDAHGCKFSHIYSAAETEYFNDFISETAPACMWYFPYGFIDMTELWKPFWKLAILTVIYAACLKATNYLYSGVFSGLYIFTGIHFTIFITPVQ